MESKDLEPVFEAVKIDDSSIKVEKPENVPNFSVLGNLQFAVPNIAVTLLSIVIWICSGGAIVLYYNSYSGRYYPTGAGFRHWFDIVIAISFLIYMVILILCFIFIKDKSKQKTMRIVNIVTFAFIIFIFTYKLLYCFANGLTVFEVYDREHYASYGNLVAPQDAFAKIMYIIASSFIVGTSIIGIVVSSISLFRRRKQ